MARSNAYYAQNQYLSDDDYQLVHYCDGIDSTYPRTRTPAQTPCQLPQTSCFQRGLEIQFADMPEHFKNITFTPTLRKNWSNSNLIYSDEEDEGDEHDDKDRPHVGYAEAINQTAFI